MSVSIQELVAELLSRPRPVLCLDTCDLLDVIRGITPQYLPAPRSFYRIERALSVDSTTLQVVITYLVKHEWEQNAEGVRLQEAGNLRTLASQLESIAEAKSYAGLDPMIVPDLGGQSLIDGLVNLARRVIDRAAILQQDRSSIDRALERVMNQRRPSHKNEIKDSIHLEHYLERARQLRAANYGEPCLFVSSNKADFWAAGGQSRIHPEIEPDFNAAGLTFYPRLEVAVRSLGI